MRLRALQATPVSNMTVNEGHKTTNGCCDVSTSPDKSWEIGTLKGPSSYSCAYAVSNIGCSTYVLGIVNHA